MSFTNDVNIVEVNLNEGWSLVSDQVYLNVINEDFDEIEKLIYFCKGSGFKKSFRWPIEIGTIQYLSLVDIENKKIYLASKALKKELRLKNLNQSSKELDQLIDKFSNVAYANSPSVAQFLTVVNDLPNFTEEKFENVIIKTSSLMQDLVEHINEYKPSLVERMSDFALNLVANFSLIRVHLLKYLVILPNLGHDLKGVEVKRLLIETLKRLITDSESAKSQMIKGQGRALPSSLITTCKIMLFTFSYIPAFILAKIIRFKVAIMAKRFIAGESIDSSKKTISELEQTNRCVTIDQLGELVISKKEADEYCNQVLEIIEGLKNDGNVSDYNEAGILKAHVSIKVTALAHDFKAQDFDYSFKQIYPRLKKILLLGKRNNVFVNIDAEHYHYRDSVLDIYGKTLLNEEELSNYSQTGIVVQAYLRDALVHLEKVKELAVKRDLIMPIRLVKGAYWDAETIEAEAHNFEAPQFLNKSETDLHFRQLVYKVLEGSKHLQLSIASHNIQDHCFAVSLQNEIFSNSKKIEHQCLHMTYEGLSIGLSKMNFPTRNYIPLGNLLVGMAYLVRRIMENSSQVGVLSIMRSHKKALKYRCAFTDIIEAKKANNFSYDLSITQITESFKNIYPVRSYLKSHLDRVQNILDKNIDELNSDKLFYNEGDVEIPCSSDESLILGRVSYDSAEEVSLKINTLFNEFIEGKWKEGINDRLATFVRLIDILLINRESLTSLIMLEAGKTIDEASADVDEAIDFIDFYLSQYQKELLGKKPGGVVAVIAPWNFPLAIACGMSVAPLIFGNTVILKAAEQTPMVAKRFMELCYKAGIPKDVFKLSLGEGNVGKAIIDHELIVGAVFTGSKAVGVEIYKKLNSQFVSEKYKLDYKVKKFAVTEMGGKNSIIVTNNCDLDETISGIMYSSFAHASQKCSAASRIIIDNNVRQKFEQRFRQAVLDAKVGKSYNHSTLINPLISKEDMIRVKDLAHKAKVEIEQYGGEILIDRSSEQTPGFCVAPSVFSVSNESELKNYTVAHEEVFGPIVHIIGYNTLDEAIEIFNNTQYALTGGIFCQSQDDLDYLLPRLNAGNLYINRPNTGARVAIEPFGGFKMSGTGPKAGSKEYLEVFYKSEKIEDFLVYDGAKNDVFSSFELKRTSKRLSSERLKIIKQLLTRAMLEQETIFYESGQELSFIAERLIHLINIGQFNLDELKFPNHRIPGQLSYSDKTISLGHGLIIDSSQKVSIGIFIDLLFNLIVGNGVNIVCTTYESYKCWSQICNLAYESGFSIYNICVNKFDEKTLCSLIKTYDFKYVLFSKNSYSEKLVHELMSKDFKEHLPKVYIESSTKDLSKHINKYTYTRSFAVNTMRYGAPLEIEA